MIPPSDCIIKREDIQSFGSSVISNLPIAPCSHARRPALLLTVVKKSETNRFDLRKSDFFLVENHLKIYEVMSTFGTILGKPMELLSHLIGQFHERHRPKRREAQSIEYPGSIFRNQHVGLFSISYFVMPDLQRHGDPGFAVIGKLYLEGCMT